MSGRALGEAEVVVLQTGGLDKAAVDRLSLSLAADEAERAGRLRHVGARRAFVAAHALLRDRLRAWTGDTPWRLDREPGGRPVLSPPCGDPPLRLSLSHADGAVAIALAQGCEIGVDIEDASEERVDSRLIETCCSLEEAAFLGTAPGTFDRGSRFLLIWTAKEAVLKARGSGLALDPRDVSIGILPPSVGFGRPAQVQLGWTLSWMRPAGHILCVAARTAGPLAFRLSIADPDDLLARATTAQGAGSAPGGPCANTAAV